MRKIVILLVSLFCLLSYSQEEYQLSTHILDISKGKGASSVLVKLEKFQNSVWVEIDQKSTDQNGRIKNFLQKNKSNIGIYKLVFFVKPYFELQKTDSFYPFVEVVFEIKDNEHYHIPITLSANGYSTYRGN